MPRMNVARTFSGDKYATESFVNEFASKTIAIKPYSFQLNDMTLSNGKYFIYVPGFVVTVENENGLSIGELERVTSGEHSGDTKVTFELDADELAALSSSTFTAYTFVNKDGTKITMLESTTL